MVAMDEGWRLELVVQMAQLINVASDEVLT
jgi:hypothetical protein